MWNDFFGMRSLLDGIIIRMCNNEIKTEFEKEIFPKDIWILYAQLGNKRKGYFMKRLWMLEAVYVERIICEEKLMLPKTKCDDLLLSKGRTHPNNRKTHEIIVYLKWWYLRFRHIFSIFVLYFAIVNISILKLKLQLC